MRVIDIQQVMAELPQLIAQAAEGKSFVIAVEGTPKVKVVPLGPENGSGSKRIGFLRGQIEVPDDFDSMGM
ncbi:MULTISPECIES: type II toxin-antitoxin system Phd/YefM family antitoxin [Halopseudomonas]|jgi:antitoxin (DNA-binding transcriptional repressor) of toxin-antitoxin stability system|uniref:Prevent-host-death protein n=2 Tax=Pseudomonadaceae TaxID=135621 RepID=A0A395QZD2_9PSED|nr:MULTISPECIES: type II toxin-antitoxin system prevent-host-death family antitoxin [Halopseudomonas]OWL86511.1 hypothetical protein B7O88_12660 [Halopseudomonas aestusnigri]RGP53218.1 hypothetical protein ASB58_16700 [Halopseudomonas gallaeciensis]SEG53899.1 Antitoxin component of toxin-antitoxin stability system, DNA-binding transcriptional repressor [Halopseudomonas aestusnigri]|tara:strand:+ start:329 stop:541 length:213 start_codon:yes stop_codon:yes gene_type:complete